MLKQLNNAKKIGLKQIQNIYTPDYSYGEYYGDNADYSIHEIRRNKIFGGPILYNSKQIPIVISSVIGFFEENGKFYE